ncbi:MAG: helix-turn-helix transcriptional regulator [Cyclobacteriaceae bacterium]|nr:helix-turn-helix transcriptional regulator [Cyclobacteriaceae bacterium]
MAIVERIKDKEKMTQQELAIKAGLTCIQIGRYETQKSNPSSVLQRLAQELHTTTDYLMNGSQNEAASAQLTDKELLRQFKEVEQFGNEDKHLVKTFLDAFIIKRHVQNLTH